MMGWNTMNSLSAHIDVAKKEEKYILPMLGIEPCPSAFTP
jgi:hypothetical protein